MWDTLELSALPPKGTAGRLCSGPPARAAAAQRTPGRRCTALPPCSSTSPPSPPALQFHADPAKNRIATVMPAARYVRFQDNAAKR